MSDFRTFMDMLAKAKVTHSLERIGASGFDLVEIPIFENHCRVEFEFDEFGNLTDVQAYDN